MVKKKVFFYTFIFLVILTSLSIKVSRAEECAFFLKDQGFIPTFNVVDTFNKIKHYIILRIPEPRHSNLFKEIDEINRSIAETSTCL